MKAILAKTYCEPEKLIIEDIPMPVPKENEVLVKVRATAINDWDWSLVRGKPHIYRLFYGLPKPKYATPGMELSGVVEAVGTAVKLFKVGDKVFGDTSEFGWGTFAEYACVNEKSLRLKPSFISFEDAAALPHASLLAWQSLVDMGRISEGMDILINGAGGGVGTYALQIAKTFNCHVTGVDSGSKGEMMKKIGFDEVIDYQKEDFSRSGKKYDLIIDAKTTRGPFSYHRCLKSDGKYITVGGSPGHLIRLLLSKIFFGRQINILSLKPNKGLEHIIDHYQSGKLKTQIDGPYSFENIPELIRYFGEGLHKGKIVVRL
jgi:NADPH:quinone reductase-like Zn-dependent oxidoreductase